MKETPRCPRSVSLQDQLEIDDLHPHLVVVGLGPGKTRGFVVVFFGGNGSQVTSIHCHTG